MSPKRSSSKARRPSQAAAGVRPPIRDELLRIAEVATGVLDGEDARSVITPPAMQWISRPHPQHAFMSGDYYDVDHATFIRVKKMLIRLERLCRVRMNCALWVPIPGRRQVTVAVHNGAHHRYYRFGLERLDIPPEMQRVLRTGRPCAAPARRGDKLVTVLAPVFDSLGEVAAVVELTAPREAYGPAWS